jgi:hypothetical protein
MRSLTFFILAGLIALAGCTANHTPRGNCQSVSMLEWQSFSLGRPRSKYFGWTRLMGPHAHKPNAQGVTRMGGYRVVIQGADKGKDFADKLADILFDEAAFNDEFAKCYDPGVGFRAWKDDEAIDVIICYKCHNAYIGAPKERVDENVAFSDARWRDLVRLAKDAFPNDPEIQALAP